jgi:DHA2 family multidrug resistance protein
MTFYSLDVSMFNIVWPGLLQGIGMALIFVPLSTIAYVTLDRRKMAEAAGIYSLIRTVGSAIGISVVTTVMTHQDQVIWNELGAQVNMYHHALTDYLGRLHMSVTDPRGLAIVAQQVGVQARMGAILDTFHLIVWSYVLMVPFVFMLKKGRSQPKPTIAAAAASAD